MGHNTLKNLLKTMTKKAEIVGCKTKATAFFFTDSSLQASQHGTKKQGVTKKEEKRRVEAKESDTSTTRPRYETSFDE